MILLLSQTSWGEIGRYSRKQTFKKSREGVEPMGGNERKRYPPTARKIPVFQPPTPSFSLRTGSRLFLQSVIASRELANVLFTHTLFPGVRGLALLLQR